MIVLVASALAQDVGCAPTIGLAAATHTARRDWDLSVPRGQVRLAPSLGAHCASRAGWIGVTATPGLRHTYGRLGGRAPLAATAEIGLTLYREDDLQLATWTFWNRSGWGMGGAVGFLIEDRPVQLRVGGMGGPSPTWLASVVVSPVKRLAPADREEAWLHGGFEVASLPALRVEADLGSAIAVGLRFGVLHRPKRDVFFRPVGLGTVTWIPEEGGVGLAVSAGMVMDGIVRPATGVAFVLDGQRPVHLGFLAIPTGARVVLVEDVGVTFRW